MLQGLWNSPIFLCLVSALGFGTWPLLARLGGGNPAWMSLVVMLPAALVGIAAASSKLAEVPNKQQFWWLIAAAAIDSLAVVFYTRLLGNKDNEMSGPLTAMTVTMVAIGAIGGLIVFSEALTPSKALGVVLAATSAWLLVR